MLHAKHSLAQIVALEGCTSTAPFSDQIRPVLLLGRLFGTGNYSLPIRQTNTCPRSWLATIWNCVLIVNSFGLILVTGNILAKYMNIGGIYHHMTVLLLIHLLWGSQMLLNSIFPMFKVRAWHSVYLKLDKIPEKTLAKPKDHAYYRRYAVIAIVVYCLLQMAGVGYITIYSVAAEKNIGRFANDGLTLPLLRWMLTVHYLSFHVATYHGVTTVLIVRYLGNSFHALETVTKSAGQLSATLLTEIRHSYLYLTDLVREMDDIGTVCGTLNVGLVIGGFCVSAYYQIQKLDWEHVNVDWPFTILVQTVVAVYQAAMFCLYAIGAARFNEKTRGLKEVLFQHDVADNLRAVTELNLILERCKDRDWGFTLGKMFLWERGNVLTVIGVITTFLAVFSQFADASRPTMCGLTSNTTSTVW